MRSGDILNLKKEHFELCVMREDEKRVLDKLSNPDAYLDSLIRRSQGFTLFKDGRIIAFCGFIQLFKGVVEVWLVPSIYAKDEPFFFLRSVKFLIETLAEANEVHRAQTSCPATEFNEKWMASLGFKCEGLMEQYTDSKEDYKLWSRIFKKG